MEYVQRGDLRRGAAQQQQQQMMDIVDLVPPPHVLVSLEEGRRSPAMMTARSEISFGSEVDEGEKGGDLGQVEEMSPKILGTFAGSQNELEELERVLSWIKRGEKFNVIN